MLFRRRIMKYSAAYSPMYISKLDICPEVYLFNEGTEKNHATILPSMSGEKQLQPS